MVELEHFFYSRCLQHNAHFKVCAVCGCVWHFNMENKSKRPFPPPLPRHMRLQEVKQVCSCLNGKVHSPTHTNTHTPIQLRYCPVEWKNFSPNHSTQLASLQFSSPGTDHNLFDLFDYFYLLIYLFCPLVLILFLLSLSFYLFEFEEKNLRSYFRPFAPFPGLTFIHRLKFLFYFFIFLFF